MTLEYEYSKSKLPKKSDYAYPFKKSDIDKALDDTGVTDFGKLFFSTGKRTDYTEGYPVIVAYLPGEADYGSWSKRQTIIGIYPVPKRHLNRIRDIMEKSDILLNITRWLSSLETASSVVRDSTRKRAAIFNNDTLHILDENQKTVRLY